MTGWSTPGDDHRPRPAWSLDATELDVQEGYRRWAPVYDAERNALIEVEEPMVDRLLANFPLRDVLDAGTGTGRHALRLASRGARVRPSTPARRC